MRRFISLLADFFRPGFLGTLGSIVGIGSGLSNILGGGGGTTSGNVPGGGGFSGIPIYQPTGQASADQLFQQLLKSMSGSQGLLSGVDPALMSSYRDMMDAVNAARPGFSSAASTVGGQYGNVANMANMFAQIMGGQGAQDFGQKANLYGAGNQIWNMATDPQDAMRQKLRQQTQDTSRASTSARGIGMGGEAAGIENQDLQNFDINWANNLLNRANLGAQSMAGLTNAGERAGMLGGADLTGALNFGQAAPQATTQSATAPFNLNYTMAGMPANVAGTYASNIMGTDFAPISQIMSQIYPYLNYGTQAGTGAFNAMNTNAAAKGQAQSSGTNALMSGLSGLNNSGVGAWLQNIFGGGGGGSSAPTDWSLSNTLGTDQSWGVA